MKKEELHEHLIRNHSKFTEYIGGLSDVLANNAMPGKWTPLQQLSHIEKSVAPVKLAFAMPKFVLSLFFGKANRQSLSYEELKANYKARLDAGGKSATRFLPDVTCDRTRLLSILNNHVHVLCRRMGKFTESELDLYRLPHPLLGKITLREMLYFTALHVQHHHAQINPSLRNAVPQLQTA
jgi:hypothetical protein